MRRIHFVHHGYYEYRTFKTFGEPQSVNDNNELNYNKGSIPIYVFTYRIEIVTVLSIKLIHPSTCIPAGLEPVRETNDLVSVQCAY